MGFLIHPWVWYEKAHPEWSKIVTYASLLVCCWGRSGFFIKNFEHILNDLFFSVNFVYLFTSVAFLLLGVSTIFVIANANTVDGRNLLKGAMSYVVCRFSSLIVWSSPKFFLLLRASLWTSTCSKLQIKTLEHHFWRCSGAVVVDYCWEVFVHKDDLLFPH